MPKINTEKIRKMWIIWVLLDSKKRQQKKLIEEIILKFKNSDVFKNTKTMISVIEKSNISKNDKEKMISDLRKSIITNFDEEKAGKQVYKSIGQLKDMGIIDREEDDANRKNKLCWLVNSSEGVPKALYEILNLFHDPEFHRIFLNFFTNTFMASEYANEVINNDLLNFIEEKLKFELSTKEKKDVLCILKLSPKSLFGTLKHLPIKRSFETASVDQEIKIEKKVINDKDDLLDLEKLKKYKKVLDDSESNYIYSKEAWIKDLQVNLSHDFGLNREYLYTPYSVTIEQELTTKIEINHNETQKNKPIKLTSKVYETSNKIPTRKRRKIPYIGHGLLPFKLTKKD